MSKKIVLITGYAGFIGGHLTREFLKKGWYVRGIDKMTYASNIDLMWEFQKNKNFKYEQTDINYLKNLYNCDYIINCAAESHVDNSIVNSNAFVESNINGVHHILELIRSSPNKPLLIHFSTDEVYGDIIDGSHTETDILRPSNPYSATKAAADMLIQAWHRTYGIPYLIVRPTNNYGQGQYIEKLIPRTIKCLDMGRKIPLHNLGKPVRTWLHVSDTVDAIETLINSNIKNEIYNIGGNLELTNIEVVKRILEVYLETNNYNLNEYVDFSYNRQGQDVRYSLNDNKLKLLGWATKKEFNTELQEIITNSKGKFVW